MNILVTGAAGLLGGAIVKELLDAGHGVIALVRQELDIRGNCGTPVKADPFAGQAPKTGRAVIVKGDVSQPDLGLGDICLLYTSTLATISSV